MEPKQSSPNASSKLLGLLSRGSGGSRSTRPILADRIRAHVGLAYIRPARVNGRKEITIRAGDVHTDLGFVSRMPAVCGALDTRKFQEEFGVELVERTGPHQGANVYFRFRILEDEPSGRGD